MQRKWPRPKYNKYAKGVFMKERNISKDRLAKIQEFNEICRLKNLMESAMPQTVQESVTIMYNGRLVDMPKKYVDRQL